MRPHHYACFFVLFCLGLIQGMKAQSSAPLYKEFIVGVNDDSFEKFIPSVKASIAAIPGVQFVGHCSGVKCVMVRYDSKTLTDVKQIHEVLINMNLKYDVKQDATIAQVSAICPVKTTDAPTPNSSGN